MSKACSASIGGVGCTDKRQRCEADACPTVPTPRGSKLLPTPQTNGVFLLPGNHLPHVYSVHVPPKQTSRRVATLCLMDERKFKRESQSLTLFSSHAKTPRLAACQMINPKKDAISWDISSDEDPFPTFPLTRSPPELHSIWGKLTSLQAQTYGVHAVRLRRRKGISQPPSPPNSTPDISLSGASSSPENSAIQPQQRRHNTSQSINALDTGCLL